MSEFQKNSNIVLNTPEGFRAEINPLGAFVDNFTDCTGVDLLFPRQIIGEKYRGGLPICAPVFGPGESVGLKQHGFARNLLWRTETSKSPNELKLTLTEPCSQDNTIPQNYAGCSMEVRYDLGADDLGNPRLSASLQILNLGPEAFICSPGFHPYFPVGTDIEKIILIDNEANEHKSFLPDEYAATQVFPGKSKRMIVLAPEYEIDMQIDRQARFVAWSANPEEYVCVEPTRHGPLHYSDGTPQELLLQQGGKYRLIMDLIFRKPK